MSETSRILKSARKYLTDPEHWCQRSPAGKATCIDLALDDAGDRYTHASQAVRRVLGLDDQPGNCHELFRWNDAPERTHAEVLDALDRAIEAEASA